MTPGDSNDASLPPAGWYPDAGRPGDERLWSGDRWTHFTRPARADRAEAVPAGWYPDTGHPGFERLWSGEVWTEEIRREAPTTSAPVVSTPVPIGVAAASPPQVSQTSVTYIDSNAPDRLGGLATWVTIGFAAVILAAVVQLVTNQRYIGLVDELMGGDVVSLQRAESVTHASHVANTVAAAVGLITAILFLVWFYRAYRNLVRAGIGDLRFGPGWAFGGWFIPIFSLVREKQIANDIWKGSASAATVGIARWREVPLPSALNWWWGLWIVGGLLGGFGRLRVAHADSTVIDHSSYETVVTTIHTSLSGERVGLWFSQAGLLAVIVAAFLAIRFVREVSRLQDQNFAASVAVQGLIPG